MSKETAKETPFNLFGVSKESFDKSKDKHPILDFSKADEFEGIIISEHPVLVKHKAKFKGEFHKIGDEIQTPVIVVKITHATKDGEDMTDEIKGVYSIWLSSKTLALGFLGLFDKHSTLKDLGFRIKVETAIYKQYGENTAYRVLEI